MIRKRKEQAEIELSQRLQEQAEAAIARKERIKKAKEREIQKALQLKLQREKVREKIDKSSEPDFFHYSSFLCSRAYNIH